MYVFKAFTRTRNANVAPTTKCLARRLVVESLEERELLTTLAVDIEDPTCDGDGPVYCSIQAAEDDASPGDTILVHKGTYDETILVDTDNLTIREANANSNPVVDAADFENGVVIDSDGVTIRGLEVRNAAGEFPFGGAGFIVNGNHNTLVNNSSHSQVTAYLIFGDHNRLIGNTSHDTVGGFIVLFGSEYNTLIGNSATRHLEPFSLFGSNHNRITQNTVSHSTFGFRIGFDSDHNTLIGNHAIAIDDDGFGFDSGFGFRVFSDSDHNTLIGNTATGSSRSGFDFEDTNQNRVIGNSSRDNGEYGFQMAELADNFFSGNHCMDNLLGGANINDIC